MTARGRYLIKHTDRNMHQIMPMMIKAGIDGWHGIQPSIGIDLAKLQEIHGDDLSLWGGLDCATLVAGTPDDVQKEALRNRTRGSQ